MSKAPKKGDIIINPKTQRPVKVGSRTWLKLVREGLVENNDYSDPNELYTIQDGDDVDEKIREINQSLPPNIQGVRGRGKYKNRIVKRHRQPSTIQTSKHTIKTTAKKLKNREVYEDLYEGGNFEEDLESLIMQELANVSINDDDDENIKIDYDYDYENIGGTNGAPEYSEEGKEDTIDFSYEDVIYSDTDVSEGEYSE